MTCRDSELYQQTNGSSRYTFDPEYGGKIDVAARRARDGSAGGAAAEAASEPARPPAERPRVRELFGSEAAARRDLGCACALTQSRLAYNVSGTVSAMLTYSCA